MWRVTILAIFYICLIFSPDVKGSCLEYGHSCWGAHGKRSSGLAIGSTKAQRGLGAKNLRSYELNVLSDENTNRNVENKFDIDDAFASAENLLRSAEEFTNDLKDPTKTRSHLKLPKFVSESDSKSAPTSFESKSNTNRAEKKSERAQQKLQQSSLSLQQQRKYPQHIERWRRFPIYASRPSFGNAPLAFTDTASALMEIQPRNSENDFVPQFEQLTDGRLGDNGAYYDVL